MAMQRSRDFSAYGLEMTLKNKKTAEVSKTSAVWGERGYSLSLISTFDGTSTTRSSLRTNTSPSAWL
jgi:hypothetical protein